MTDLLHSKKVKQSLNKDQSTSFRDMAKVVTYELRSRCFFLLTGLSVSFQMKAKLLLFSTQFGLETQWKSA